MKLRAYQLRAYQQNAVDNCLRLMKENEGNFAALLVLLATGAGKTPIYCEIINKLSHKKILVLSHSAKLIEQGAKTLNSMNSRLPIGIYSADLGRKDFRHNILFATIQSAGNKSSKILKRCVFDLIIIDEAHRVSSSQNTYYSQLIESFKEKNPNLKIIGLTATPYRIGSGYLWEGESSIWKEELIACNVAYGDGLLKLFEDGYLCPLTTKIPQSAHLSLDGVRSNGDYNIADLEKANPIEKLQEIAAAAIPLTEHRKKILAFVAGIQHAIDFTQVLKLKGKKADCVHGKRTKAENDAALKNFIHGDVQYLVGVDKLTTGFDFPNLGCILQLRPTQSASLHIQMLGRGTRINVEINEDMTSEQRLAAIAASDKPNCLVIDFTDNIEKNGTLANPIVAANQPKYQFNLCHACGTVNDKKNVTCYECGTPLLDVNENESQKESALNSAQLSDEEEENTLPLEPKIDVDIMGYEKNRTLTVRATRFYLEKIDGVDRITKTLKSWATETIEKIKQGQVGFDAILRRKLANSTDLLAKKLRGDYSNAPIQVIERKIKEIGAGGKERIRIEYECVEKGGYIMKYKEYLCFSGYDPKAIYHTRAKWKRLTNNADMPANADEAYSLINKLAQPVESITVDLHSQYKNVVEVRMR